jgi:prepilin-type N-terminal cleavage/methylation domain-containing protein
MRRQSGFTPIEQLIVAAIIGIIAAIAIPNLLNAIDRRSRRGRWRTCGRSAPHARVRDRQQFHPIQTTRAALTWERSRSRCRTARSRSFLADGWNWGIEWHAHRRHGPHDRLGRTARPRPRDRTDVELSTARSPSCGTVHRTRRASRPSRLTGPRNCRRAARPQGSPPSASACYDATVLHGRPSQPR